MYLLYIDESGGADEKDQKHFVLGGVIAHEKRPYHLNADLDAIQQELFPKITDKIEFHASAIRNGNGEPWKSMGRAEREEVLVRIYEHIAQTSDNVSLLAVAMDKQSYSSANPIRKTCLEMVGHFDGYLEYLELRNSGGQRHRERGEKERGLVIFDQSDHQKTLHAVLEEVRTVGAHWGKVRHIAEIPMFTDSRLTRMLQLADLVAYAVFRRYERGESRYFDIIVNKFHESDGVMHGLVHITTNRDGCYCPACLTRRQKERTQTARASTT